jgi:uroporphyrin-III C-methyltransferase
MESDTRLAALIADLPRLEPGHVWLVGAGPGDPGYLTLHAVSALAQADVIVHDALVDDRVARSPAPVHGSSPRQARPPALAEQGRSQPTCRPRPRRQRVVAQGQPTLMFGRAGEEMLARRAAVPARLGVTAGLAEPRRGADPRARGVNQAVIFATGHGAGDGPRIDWAALARTGQPLIVYMAMHQLAAIAADLIAGGLPADTPAAVIASATLPGERVVVAPLDGIAAATAAEGMRPAMVVIGGIVRC